MTTENTIVTIKTIDFSNVRFQQVAREFDSLEVDYLQMGRVKTVLKAFHRVSALENILVCVVYHNSCKIYRLLHHEKSIAIH